MSDTKIASGWAAINPTQHLSAQAMLELVLNQLPLEEFAEFVRLTNEANEEFWNNAEMHTGGWKTGGLE